MSCTVTLIVFVKLKKFSLNNIKHKININNRKRDLCKNEKYLAQCKKYFIA